MDCVVFGVGGSYVFDVDETLWRLGWNVRAYVSNRPVSSEPHGLDPIVSVADVNKELVSLPTVVAVATPSNRKGAVEEARTAGFSIFPPVVDPTSPVARTVTVEVGAMVNAAVVIAPRSRIASFAIVNRGCSIGHDTVVEDYAFLGPSVVLSGSAIIGSGAFLGAGSIILPGVKVGVGAVVGAGAVVVHDVPDGSTAVGNPARTPAS